MIMRQLTYEELNQLMQELKENNNTISREAVVVVLDEGICTEERPFTDYMMVMEIAEKIVNK